MPVTRQKEEVELKASSGKVVCFGVAKGLFIVQSQVGNTPAGKDCSFIGRTNS